LTREEWFNGSMGLTISVWMIGRVELVGIRLLSWECPLLVQGSWASDAGCVSGAAGYVDLFYFLGRDAVPLGYGAADGALDLLGGAAVLCATYYGH
jgi:hypothetical protein